MHMRRRHSNEKLIQIPLDLNIGVVVYVLVYHHLRDQDLCSAPLFV